MFRMLGNVTIIGGTIFLLVVSINDTLAFFEDTSLINLIVRMLISTLIVFVVFCIARKLLDFENEIGRFSANFMEELVWFSDIWCLLGGCLGVSLGLHISIPVLIFVFDIFFGFLDFMKKIS